jgi:DNA mismatch repair protein MutL
MSKIHYLAENLKNMIAAGEVVERPSGIIKELVDNSIDANASRIEIRIEDGGLSLLEVIDNGSGMDFEDSLMCFKRHATSKIKDEDDLWRIHTLGFRGEALPSISSVAHVELKSSDGNYRTEVIMDYGKLLKHEVCACNKGTSIKVNGLFFQTPARLKHLKNNHYEQSLIVDIIYKFALAHPEISFVLSSNGKNLLETAGDNNLRNTIFAVYGREIASNSFKIVGEDLDYTVEGIGVLPVFSRANKNYINIYINSRMVRSYGIQKNIIEAYHRYMPDNRYPIVAINIKMDASLVDVNVHPAKWEIRLSKQKQLELLIFETIKKALVENLNGAPIIEKEINRKIEPNRFKASQMYMEKNELFKDTPQLNKFNEENKIYNEPINNEVNLDSVIIKNKVEEIVNNDNSKSEILAKDEKISSLRIIGSLHGSYILCEGESGLYIIDQHAAEERYHYELFSRQMFNNKKTEDLLIPLELNIDRAILDKINDVNKDMKQVGLFYELFGDKVIVRTIPVWMKKIDDPKVILEDILDLYDNSNFILNELTKDKIATKACKASIKFNHQLSMIEMKQLLVNLSSCDNPYNCPHGRPTIVSFNHSDLERLFKR